MNNTIYDACVDAVNRNAISLASKVDSIEIVGLVGGGFEAQVTHDCMTGDWVEADTVAEAIVIACARALER